MRSTLVLTAVCTLMNCAQSEGRRKESASVGVASAAALAVGTAAAAPRTVATLDRPTLGSAAAESAAAPPEVVAAPLPEATALRSARAVGHTSVVLKLGYAGGARAAFKPASRRGGGRYRGEIAAYLLAKALGLHGRVLPARRYDIGLAPLLAVAAPILGSCFNLRLPAFVWPLDRLPHPVSSAERGLGGSTT
jgi:hypothetical protein